MKWFYDLKIGKKLIIAFLVVSAITAFVGIMGIRNMGAINTLADDIYLNQVLGIAYVKEANIDLLFLVRAEKSLLLSSSEGQRQKYMEAAKKAEDMYKDNMEKAKPLFHTEIGKAGIARVEKAWEEYLGLHRQLVDLAKKEKLNENKASVEMSMGPLREKLDVLDDAFMYLTKHKEEDAKVASEETTRIYQSSRALMIALILGGVAVGIFFGLFISRIIKKPIQNLLEAADKLAIGDVNVSIEASSKDELGGLAQSFKAMAENIKESARGAEKVAEGDLTVEIKAKSENDVLAKSMKNAVDTLRGLVAEAVMLSGQP